MSTRCRIGMALRNGKVVSVYCHSDGYPTGVGSILQDYYKSEDKIIKLLNLGDLSTLGTEPIACPDLWDYNSGMSALAFECSYNIPLCRTYNSRGEETHATLSDIDEFLSEEYAYLFKNNQWFNVYKETEESEVTYEPLSEAISREAM